MVTTHADSPRRDSRGFDIPGSIARQRQGIGHNDHMTIREATPADVPEILAMIHELADYEKAPHEVVATPGLLRDALFGDDPAVYALMAEDDESGQSVGFALWFRNFSTWLGRHGLYLEDLYVRPSHRGHGYGKALLQELARIAVDRGYGRFEWWVLDWNQPALDFYRSIGAVPMDEWTVQRVSGDALRRLAGGT
jgi:GNAT superfamily N-acetyltransferase